MKVLLSILLFALLIGCTDRRDTPRDQLENKRFLENKGYHVISYEGRADRYELTRQKLVALPYMMHWALQPVDPGDYLGKTVDVEQFIVDDHPLAEGKVDVYVYVVDRRPIGGNSYPHGDASDGGYWSLEGKTLEEIQPKSKSYQEWRKDWVDRYSE
ncbi:hypothetical protein [Paenibacillus sacheonensis]|uniref:Lipoprotein n=1 Tax=Paenibacillus sacheonensis TaxID=742054 RepID=A0A7X5C0B6_9BACL|nr:hypothetical protein [Paenibacillus sacheonensis]MBM7564546.1 hypothetical protein [Paenibacillus sacheonensis]NBC69105.1 hypothetical protein [Paenibacillus sacheonensis]